MTDGLGPRLTNSPGMRRAEQWAIDKFNGWGLANVHRDGFEFGRGWEIVLVSARMMSPRPLELTAIPVAWTPPTNGTVSATIVVAQMSTEEHFADWKGHVAGQLVMVSLHAAGIEPDNPQCRPLGAADFQKRDGFRPTK